MTLPIKASINPSLTRKLILNKHPKQRISQEAVQLTAELLRLFILEARNRASVEVSARHYNYTVRMSLLLGRQLTPACNS